MIERIVDKRPHDLGGGFEVGRVLPFHARQMVGPFIFFDHLGPVDCHLSVRRRDNSSRQLGLQARNPPRRSELDGGG